MTMAPLTSTLPLSMVWILINGANAGAQAAGMCIGRHVQCVQASNRQGFRNRSVLLARRRSGCSRKIR